MPHQLQMMAMVPYVYKPGVWIDAQTPFSSLCTATLASLAREQDPRSKEQFT